MDEIKKSKKNPNVQSILLKCFHNFSVLLFEKFLFTGTNKFKITLPRIFALLHWRGCESPKLKKVPFSKFVNKTKIRRPHIFFSFAAASNHFISRKIRKRKSPKKNRKKYLKSPKANQSLDIQKNSWRKYS